LTHTFNSLRGPYAFFISGLLQLIAGLVECTRNNIYGATAFLAFGSFWLANGTRLILLAYFPEQIPEEYLVADPWGNFIRNFYIMAFVGVLFKQTLVGSKLTSVLIALLFGQMFATTMNNGWAEAFAWIQMIVGTIVSVFAFYLFTAEFTNEVYGREVFSLYPWHEESPDQLFAAAGRFNTLQTTAVHLRAAGKSFHYLRSVQPVNGVTTK
jgi:succinate-acetate transporter protein